MKIIIRIIALVLVVMTPILSFSLYADSVDDPYEKTYLGAFDEKYLRLYDTEGKKIIFIGGSSLPFGLRSDLIEQELDGEYSVINFGLYATLGTKFMMDMAKDAISKGDIVILCPELYAQTYSLYFNPEATLQATGGISRLNLKLSIEEQISLAYNYYDYATERIKYDRKGNAPDPIGIYRADSFNYWGDISVERPNNIMNNGYDSNMDIYTDESLLDADFIAYVNEYIAEVREVGAEIYFNYSPLNALAIRSSKNMRAQFESRLDASIDCDLLGTIEDYVIDERYFYDTNFHLNSDGAVYFSNMLTLSLKRVLGMDPISSISVPMPPALAGDEVVNVEISDTKIPFDQYNGEPNADYVDMFEYARTGASYKIVGVKDEYIGMTEVILPSVYDGRNVTAVDSNAFYGCAMLEYIHIGKTYKSLSKQAFAGCVSLKGVYLYEMDGNRISPPGDGLLDGAVEGLKIYIPEGANYSTGYTWTKYLDHFVTFSKAD